MPSQAPLEALMIVEGVVTTVNADGTVNIAPMGPIVSPDFAVLRLRPWQTSTTFGNLKRTGHGVFHITDDVLLLAKAAVGRLTPQPELIPLSNGDFALADACRWYTFRVQELDDSEDRAEILAPTLECTRRRDFLGFNRAKHAVVELAILCTRLHLAAPESVIQDVLRLKTPIEKTAGPQEHAAFAFLLEYLREAGITLP